MGGDRVSELISLFKQLENWLRDSLRATNEPFYALLNVSENPIIRRNFGDIRQFAELRNIYSHADRAVAEPTDRTLLKLSDILKAVTEPPLVTSLVKPLRVFDVTSRLDEALKYMHANDFSQIVLDANGRTQLITTENISAWVERQISEESIIMGSDLIGAVLTCAKHDSYEFSIYNRASDQKGPAVCIPDHRKRKVDGGSPRNCYAVGSTD